MGAAPCSWRLFWFVLPNPLLWQPPLLWFGCWTSCTWHRYHDGVEGAAYEWSECSGACTRTTDFFDLFEPALNLLAVVLEEFVIAGSLYGGAVGAPLFFFLGATLMIVLVAQAFWSRPLARSRRRGTCLLHSWAAVLLPLAVATPPVAAMAPDRPSYQWWLSKPPPPQTDIELWCSGQSTIVEQMAMAMQRATMESPLQSGGVWPTEVHAEGPPVVTGGEQVGFDDLEPPENIPLDFEDDEDVTIHISFFVMSPNFQSESIDISLEFPLAREDTLGFVVETARIVAGDWLTWAVFTQPQLDDDFASVLVLPTWLEASGKAAMVLDARGIHRGVFAFYHSGEITYQNVIDYLGSPLTEPVDVYAYGANDSMDERRAVQPVTGGVFKIMPTGTMFAWPTPIEDRLEDPLTWDPDTAHPDHVGGSHLAFQTATRQLVHPLQRGDEYTPLSVASELFDVEQHRIWVRAPTRRPTGLYWLGRRIHSIIAVVSAADHPPPVSRVVTLDLRGLGLWPMWVAITQPFFFPGDIIEALDIGYLPGYSLVVTGGRRGRTPGLLWVEDGDLIEASLRPTTEVPPTPPDNHGPSPPDGWDESGESSGAPEDNIPGSRYLWRLSATRPRTIWTTTAGAYQSEKPITSAPRCAVSSEPEGGLQLRPKTGPCARPLPTRWPCKIRHCQPPG